MKLPEIKQFDLVEIYWEDHKDKGDTSWTTLKEAIKDCEKAHVMHTTGYVISTKNNQITLGNSIEMGHKDKDLAYWMSICKPLIQKLEVLKPYRPKPKRANAKRKN